MGDVVEAGDRVKVARVLRVVSEKGHRLGLGAVRNIGTVAAVNERLVVGVGLALHVLARRGGSVGVRLLVVGARRRP